MKLLIDIPDTTYAFVKQLQWVGTGRGNCKTVQQTVINSIKFGVKQPQGKWICTVQSSFPQYEPDEYRCSECDGIGYKLDKFCKHCGASMQKGDSNE